MSATQQVDADLLEQTAQGLQALTAQLADESARAMRLKREEAERKLLEAAAEAEAIKMQREVARLEAEQKAEDDREEKKAADKRFKFWTRYVVGPVALAVVGGGGAQMKSSFVDEPEPVEVDAKEMKKAVAPAVQEAIAPLVKEQADALEQRRSLAARSQRQESVQVDGVRFIGRQLEAAHPGKVEALRKVKKSKAMDDAEKRVDKRRNEQAIDQILNPKDDPLELEK